MPKKLATGKRKDRVSGRSTPKRELLGLPRATTVAGKGHEQTMGISKTAGRVAKAKSAVGRKSDASIGEGSLRKLKGKAVGKKAARLARPAK